MNILSVDENTIVCDRTRFLNARTRQIWYNSVIKPV